MIPDRSDIRIPLIYLAASMLWIFFSDSIMFTLVPQLEDVHMVGVVKGLAFVTATGLLLHWLLSRDRKARLAAESDRERIRAERENLLQELQMHIDRMPIGYIVTDADFRFEFLNPSAERIFGFTKEELRGRSPYGTVIPIDAKAFVEEVRAGWLAGSLDAHGANVNLTKDGREVVCDWFNTPVFDPQGRFLRLISMVRDVTAQTRMVEELRRSEERYRTLFEQAKDGILILSDGRFSSCNASAAAMLGRSRDEIVGRTPPELSPAVQPGGWASRQLAEELMLRAQEGEPLVFEWLHLHRDGSEVVIEVSLTRVNWSESPLLLCLWRDVTQRRRWENELIESRGRLRALAARLDEVREEERTRLSREIHDGLGQILTGIKIDNSIIERALRRQGGADLASAQQTLASIGGLVDEAIEQARGIARQLRPGMLAEAGLVEVLQQFVAEFEKRSGLRCRTVLPAQAPALTLRQGLALYRITQEATTNILRHAGATGVALELHVTADLLVLEIRDDGVGISAQDFSKKQSLGIVSMKERAALLGGICHVRPGTGSGTVVRVELPLGHEHEGAGDDTAVV